MEGNNRYESVKRALEYHKMREKEKEKRKEATDVLHKKETAND
jgi:hypothetical protein